MLGQGGTGKTWFANEQAQHQEGYRVYACCKTHAGVAGLQVDGAMHCTLVALQRRYVALGAIEAKSVIIVDEISLATTQDFHTPQELRKLGCALWLIVDPASQLLAIGDAWIGGADLTGDISGTAMLRSAVDCKRCVFREPKRCDERLFAWLKHYRGGEGGAGSCPWLTRWRRPARLSPSGAGRSKPICAYAI